jgi:hypothetical protein
MTVSEPTWWREWWEEVSPVWLFRAKPTDFADPGGICMGMFWLPGLIVLVSVHYFFLVCPAAIWLELGWHPLLALWLTPVTLLWAGAVVADIRFRRQEATFEQIYWFDNTFINWLGYVTSPLVPVVFAVGLVWFVVKLFI